MRLEPGDVEAVSPDASATCTACSNAFDDRVSISIHVYGANIGAVRRHTYPPAAGASPSSPATPTRYCPNLGPIRRTPCSTHDRHALLRRRARPACWPATRSPCSTCARKHPFAQAHPLWAANLPLSRIELDAWRRIPRRDTLIVRLRRARGQRPRAARGRAPGGAGLHATCSLLEGGLDGWRSAGGELFRDVNVPSKAFGELVEHERHTPSLAAEEVQALIDAKADVVVLDARRFDEYQTMSIPDRDQRAGRRTGAARPRAGARPGHARHRQLRRPHAQHHRHAVAGECRAFPTRWRRCATAPSAGSWPGRCSTTAPRAARPSAERRRTRAAAPRRRRSRGPARRRALDRRCDALATLEAPGRTLYRFDVRTPEEYEAGHLPGFASAPGGQLVQETDHHVPVRGARIVLADDDGVRAPMTASWLAQMGWEVYVLAPQPAAAYSERGAAPAADRPRPRRTPAATAGPTKAPTRRPRPCRPTWTGSSAWWRSWSATARTAFACSE